MPITLLNKELKILARVLANRLQVEETGVAHIKKHQEQTDTLFPTEPKTHDKQSTNRQKIQDHIISRVKK